MILELLVVVALASSPPEAAPTEAGGWGMMMPMVSVRYTKFSGLRPLMVDVDLRGPLQTFGAGRTFTIIGGLAGTKSWSLTSSAFAFSQGLDPGKEVQVGCGLGLGLSVAGLLSAGVGVGYDMIRIRAEDGSIHASGLLAFRDLAGPSVTYFVMFSLSIPDGAK